MVRLAGSRSLQGMWNSAFLLAASLFSSRLKRFPDPASSPQPSEVLDVVTTTVFVKVYSVKIREGSCSGGSRVSGRALGRPEVSGSSGRECAQRDGGDSRSHFRDTQAPGQVGSMTQPFKGSKGPGSVFHSFGADFQGPQASQSRGSLPGRD